MIQNLIWYSFSACNFQLFEGNRVVFFFFCDPNDLLLTNEMKIADISSSDLYAFIATSPKWQSKRVVFHVLQNE